MKIEITHADCAGHEIGDIIEVEGDKMPAWAEGKARVTGVGAKRVTVTNPAKGKADD